MISKVALSLCLLISGCAAKYAEPGEEATSSLNYLYGELALKEEKPSEATRYFEKVFSEDPNPLVGKRLVQLYAYANRPEDALAVINQLEPDLELLRARYNLEIALGQTAAAIETLKQVISLEETPSEAEQFTLASLLLNSGRSTEATVILKQLKENKKARLLLANLEINAGNLEQARASLEGLDPEERETGLLYVKLLIREQKVEEAEQVVEALSARYPKDPSVLKARSAVQLAKKENDLALELLEEASELELDNYSTRLRIALLKLESGKVAQAETDLSILAKEKPDNYRVWYFLALAQINSGKPKLALESLDQILPEAGPVYRSSKTLSADLYRKEENFGAAAREVSELTREYPDDLQLLSLLGFLQRQNKDLEGAAKTLEKIVDKQKNTRNMYALASIYDELGEKKKAIELGREILKSDPDDANTANFLAYLLALEKTDLDEAEELVKKALKQEPKNGYFLDTLAWVYYAKKDYRQALEYITAALDYVPNDAVILKHYAEILEKLGQKKKARSVYLKALEKSDVKTDIDFIKDRLDELD